MVALAYALYNLAMDGGLVAAALALAGDPLTWRAAAAAAAGAAYALVPVGVDGGTWGHVVASALVAWWAAPWRGWRRWGLRWAALWVAALAVGGLALALQEALTGHLPSTAHPSPWWAAASAGAVVAAARWLGTARRRGRLWAFGQRPRVQTLVVGLDGRTASVPALVDTGNDLRDPWGHRPVVVAEARALSDLLPPYARHALDAYAREVAAGGEDPPDGGAGFLAALMPPWQSRLRVIPYHSVGGDGILAALVPDSLALAEQGALLPLPPGLVALCWRPLRAAGAHALLPPSLAEAHTFPMGA